MFIYFSMCFVDSIHVMVTDATKHESTREFDEMDLNLIFVNHADNIP
jgi:hypothetical protein